MLHDRIQSILSSSNDLACSDDRAVPDNKKFMSIRRRYRAKQGRFFLTTQILLLKKNEKHNNFKVCTVHAVCAPHDGTRRTQDTRTEHVGTIVVSYLVVTLLHNLHTL
jgi:hypothetical protein